MLLYQGLPACHKTKPIASGRKAYSAECVEGEFCELRVDGVLRSLWLRRRDFRQAAVLAGSTLQTLIWGGVRVAQRRCALYGLLIYRQGDGAGFFFGYDFYRNKVVSLPEVKEPRYRDIRELKVPVVVYVEVVYLTDAAASGVEDLLLAEFVVRGTRVLVVL